MRRNLSTAVLYTIVTTVLFGVAYAFVVTGLAQVLFHEKANGQLIEKDGQLIGLRIIGQPFSAPQYFHSRPSAAGWQWPTRIRAPSMPPRWCSSARAGAAPCASCVI